MGYSAWNFGRIGNKLKMKLNERNYGVLHSLTHMADESSCCEEQLTQVEGNSVMDQTFSRKSCVEYTGILEELTQELQSAKKIIQLLQEDVKKSTEQSVSAIPRFTCENNTSSVSDSESSWENVLHKSSNQFNPHNSQINRWPIPVIITSNHFDILHNLETDRQLPDNKLIISSKIYNNRGKSHLWKSSFKGSQVKSQKKMVIIGDSHVRGLTSELKNNLGHDYSISSTFMPGAGLQNITKLAKSEISTLTNRDAIIVCGGSNDVSRDMSQMGLNSLKNFVNLRTNTKVLILALSLRHDLSEDSCVNKEIHSFNRKLHKIMKTIEMAKILDYDIAREDFTRHGQHLNSSGKSKVALLIAQHLTKSKSSNIDPIPLRWKTTTTSDFIPIGCETMDLNNDTRDPDNDEKEEIQPTTSNQNNRT